MSAQGWRSPRCVPYPHGSPELSPRTLTLRFVAWTSSFLPVARAVAVKLAWRSGELPVRTEVSPPPQIPMLRPCPPA